MEHNTPLLNQVTIITTLYETSRNGGCFPGKKNSHMIALFYTMKELHVNKRILIINESWFGAVRLSLGSILISAQHSTIAASKVL